jgi:hypothetical protein
METPGLVLVQAAVERQTPTQPMQAAMVRPAASSLNIKMGHDEKKLLQEEILTAVIKAIGKPVAAILILLVGQIIGACWLGVQDHYRLWSIDADMNVIKPRVEQLWYTQHNNQEKNP